MQPAEDVIGAVGFAVISIQRLYLAAEDDAKTGTLRISDLRKAGIRR